MNRSTWRQIGGDMNPGAYGGIIARFDRNAVEVREIQPVLEHESIESAQEIGFPFWTREAYYDVEDLDPSSNPDIRSAMRNCGLTEEMLEDLTSDQRLFALAECALQVGLRVEEGPSGWAKDVVPKRVHWWSGEVAGPKYLADEDEEFFQKTTPVTVRVAYEIWTDEDVEAGDTDNKGWVDEEGSEYIFEDVVQMLRMAEPSSSKFHDGIWYKEPEYHTNDQTGETESRSYFIDAPVKVQRKLFKEVMEA